ncbi:MAG: DUF998 domain-containing protein [Bacteroidota bacterium]
MKRHRLGILSLSGAIGPAIFTLAIVSSAALRPKYDHLHDFISALGASGSPTEYLMNFGGFLPTGFLMLVFGCSLYITLSGSKSFLAIIGCLLIVLFGLGMIIVGVYSCDGDCFESVTKEGLIHGQVSAIIFNAVVIGILLLGIAFRRQIAFRKFMWYSILSAVLAAVFIVKMVGSFETRTFTGLWQRLFLLTIFTWTTVIGWSNYTSGKKTN